MTQVRYCAHDHYVQRYDCNSHVVVEPSECIVCGCDQNCYYHYCCHLLTIEKQQAVCRPLWIFLFLPLLLHAAAAAAVFVASAVTVFVAIPDDFFELKK